MKAKKGPRPPSAKAVAPPPRPAQVPAPIRGHNHYIVAKSPQKPKIEVKTLKKDEELREAGAELRQVVKELLTFADDPGTGPELRALIDRGRKALQA